MDSKTIDTYQKVNFESDFRKWLVFSNSVKNVEDLKILKQAIYNKTTVAGVTFTMERSETETCYILAEQENPLRLKIAEIQFPLFVQYFQEHYDATKNSINAVPTEHDFLNAQNSNTQTAKLPNQNKTAQIQVAHQRNSPPFLRKLCSDNKIIHSFKFSIVTLVVLQAVLIPGNLGGYSLGNLGTYGSFGIMTVLWVISVLVYAKYFNFNNSYKETFKLTASFFAFIWLFTYIEVIIIDAIKGRFDMWFSLFLLVIGQFAGIFISLFATMILYFVRGGKVVNEQ